MEPFEYFIEDKKVHRISVNLARAKSLIKDSEERIAKSNKLDVNDFAKIIFENIYDAIRDLCDAVLILDGWKSFSHEASISYLLKKGFDVSVVDRLDKFKYKRNGSKYYGEKIDIWEAKDIKAFYLEIKDKLYKLLEKAK